MDLQTEDSSKIKEWKDLQRKIQTEMHTILLISLEDAIMGEITEEEKEVFKKL